MFSFQQKNKVFFIAIIFCLIAFQSFILNAQMRTRTSDDSSFARQTHTWFDNTNYQFENQYSKLSTIPPLSTDMTYEIILAYVFLDSIVKNYTREGTLTRWQKNRSKNDTINAMVKYLYMIKDYDPQRFYQYAHTTSAKYYKSNINFIQGTVLNLVDKIESGNINRQVMNDLCLADYAFRVQINSIDSLPSINHPGEFVYGVKALVIDTLKGRQFQNCCSPGNSSKSSHDKELTTSACICFNYYTGPYSNDDVQIDNSLKNASGNLKLLPGQQLIVTLGYFDYKWDYNFDYFCLSLLRALPIIGNNVIDINREFSSTTPQPYSIWKNSFNQKVNLILNGGY